MIKEQNPLYLVYKKQLPMVSQNFFSRFCFQLAKRQLQQYFFFFQRRPVILKFTLHLHQSAQMQVSTSYIYNFIIELIHIFPTLQTFLMNFDSSLFFNGDCFHFWNHCSQSISVSNNLFTIFFFLKKLLNVILHLVSVFAFSIL